METKMTERTWQITEQDGTKRTVTLAQFRATIDERKAAAQPIADAWRNGDIDRPARVS
jgi:hypothetical protein